MGSHFSTYGGSFASSCLKSCYALVALLRGILLTMRHVVDPMAKCSDASEFSGAVCVSKSRSSHGTCACDRIGARNVCHSEEDLLTIEGFSHCVLRCGLGHSSKDMKTCEDMKTRSWCLHVFMTSSGLHVFMPSLLSRFLFSCLHVFMCLCLYGVVHVFMLSLLSRVCGRGAWVSEVVPHVVPRRRWHHISPTRSSRFLHVFKSSRRLHVFISSLLSQLGVRAWVGDVVPHPWVAPHSSNFMSLCLHAFMSSRPHIKMYSRRLHVLMSSLLSRLGVRAWECDVVAHRRWHHMWCDGGLRVLELVHVLLHCDFACQGNYLGLRVDDCKNQGFGLVRAHLH
jgi:hypothetical protein